MKTYICRHCQKCQKYQSIEYEKQDELICPSCKQSWGKIKNLDDVFDYCPICECRQFYLSKDFNQFAGCLILVIGILLVPKTYGLSLPVVALIDYFLFRRVKYIANCYRCGTEFKGFDCEKRFKPFMHHIGLKYDKYRK